jgi:protein disulfide-isomerase
VKRNSASLCILAITLAIVFINRANAEESESTLWQTDPNQAWRAAQQAHRPLLLYFTMENCVYCRKMERDTWSHPAVASDLRRNFVAANVDGEKNADLARKLRIRAYPTTVIILPTGGVVDHISGYVPPQHLTMRLATATRRHAAATTTPRTR